MLPSGPLVVPIALVAIVFQLGGLLSESPLSLIGHAERLTLDVVLIIALKKLWSSNQKKDTQLLTMGTKVAETMALTQDAIRELRTTTEELGGAMDNLASNIAALPCSMSSRLEEQLKHQSSQ